ncbi:Mediator of RNA polymerase II transcription subunit 18 [Podochytrium sp. JEL0797]|nr:Mediator of RNA polymerase II transcription subunit 18 [Podochytrium sp. JEL0797]
MTTQQTSHHFECSLAGTVAFTTVPPLIERIAGLTGSAAILLADGVDTAAIGEHECVFVGAGGDARTLLHLRADLMGADCVDPEQSLGDPSEHHPGDRNKWSLLFVAPPQPPKKGQLATVRAVYDAKVRRGNVFEYLELLEYRLAFEFVRKGYRFHFGDIQITISCIHKFQKRHDPTSLVPVDPEGSWLVELVTDRTFTENIPFVSERLAAFARNLRGLVDLSIVDINKYGSASLQLR